MSYVLAFSKLRILRYRRKSKYKKPNRQSFRIIHFKIALLKSLYNISFQLGNGRVRYTYVQKKKNDMFSRNFHDFVCINNAKIL